MDSMITARFRVYGIVQGVGFRPTVDRHAASAGIRGSVCNKGPYVEIFAQGSPEGVGRFRDLLRESPPRRAVILKIDEKPVHDAPSFHDFSIVESEKTTGEIYISPDIAICDECAQELFDPGNRRYLHPFINCTCCGPRLTILDALPYDRERTSMKMFPMCKTCSEEYHSPLSRRYDAQPVCCNVCGPKVYLLHTGSSENGEKNAGRSTGREAVLEARRTILAGGIIAVKGIGGFHLCCDATNEDAVHRLRLRKHRPAKPFAVMMRDETTVRRECAFNEEQRQILTGHQKPILLLDRKGDLRPDEKSSGADAPAKERALSEDVIREGPRLAPSVAPGNPKVGVMLPYAPLHLLLFSYDDGLQMPDCLIMTSGNVSGAPICRDDADALSQIADFCDCILSHDRMIRIRADDTVMDFHRGRPYMIRRSRGYAPLPVLLSEERKGCVLAVGAELKNTFCISSGNLYYLSPYVGDLEDLRTVRALEETIGRMETLLEVQPQAVVCDLHPKYNATAVAEKIAEKRGIPVFRIQHHYAHVLSCMAENDRTDPVIGVSFDGTGYGTDGTIWGGEIMTADFGGFSRVCSIAPFVQIGGDSAPRQGWRIAASMLWTACKNEAFRFSGSVTGSRPDAAGTYFSLIKKLGICDEQNARAQRMMAERGIQAVTSTSAGRLFDAVSAMLGICRESTYEGEASIELEFAAERFAKSNVPEADDPEAVFRNEDFMEEDSQFADFMEADFMEADFMEADFMEAVFQNADFMEEVFSGTGRMERDPGETGNPGTGCVRLSTDRLFALLLEKKLSGEDPEKLAYLFHAALAGMIVRACVRISAWTGIHTAALTGGCFQNRLLLTLTEDGLHKKGMEVLLHHLVPPNDGGLALGQAAAAMYRMQE